MENLVKFTFVFLIRDLVACLHGHISLVAITRVAGTINNPLFLQGVSLTGNSDSLASEGGEERCVNSTSHRARVTHAIFSCVPQGLTRLQCLFGACSECVALKPFPSISRAMCSTLLDAPSTSHTRHFPLLPHCYFLQLGHRPLLRRLPDSSNNPFYR